MRVYVAGPISNGEDKHMGYQSVVDNIRNAVTLGGRIADRGYSPFVPHLTHFWNLMDPRPYSEWLRLDDEWVLASDVVYRMPGASKGADHEVALAKAHGIPVVYSMEELDAVYQSKTKGSTGPLTGEAGPADRQQGRIELRGDGASCVPDQGSRVCCP